MSETYQRAWITAEDIEALEVSPAWRAFKEIIALRQLGILQGQKKVLTTPEEVANYNMNLGRLEETNYVLKFFASPEQLLEELQEKKEQDNGRDSND